MQNYPLDNHFCPSLVYVLQTGVSVHDPQTSIKACVHSLWCHRQMHMTWSSTTLTLETSNSPSTPPPPKKKCLKGIPNNEGHTSFPHFVILLFEGTCFCILFMLNLLIQFIKTECHWRNLLIHLITVCLFFIYTTGFRFWSLNYISGALFLRFKYITQINLCVFTELINILHIIMLINETDPEKQLSPALQYLSCFHRYPLQDYICLGKLTFRFITKNQCLTKESLNGWKYLENW